MLKKWNDLIRNEERPLQERLFLLITLVMALSFIIFTVVSIVTGATLLHCLILLEQGVLDYDAKVFTDIEDGTTSAYTFLLQKINKIEITPAQLALDKLHAVVHDPPDRRVGEPAGGCVLAEDGGERAEGAF